MNTVTQFNIYVFVFVNGLKVIWLHKDYLKTIIDGSESGILSESKELLTVDLCSTCVYLLKQVTLDSLKENIFDLPLNCLISLERNLYFLYE